MAAIDNDTAAMKVKEEAEESEEEEEEDEEEEEEGEEGEEDEGEGDGDGDNNDEEQSQEQSNFTYRCVICDERFESDADFHKHRIHHDKCPQCSEVFLCHKELIIHLSLHAVEGNICLFCRKISNTKDSFEEHLNAHRQHFKTLDCQTCGMKLLTSEEFKIHLCRTGKSATATATAVAAPPVAEKKTKRASVTKDAKDDDVDVLPSKRIKVEKDEEGNGEVKSDSIRLADQTDIKIENVGSDDTEVGAPISTDDVKEEDPEKPFKCGYCATPYAESSQLYFHMTQVHPDKLT